MIALLKLHTLLTTKLRVMAGAFDAHSILDKEIQLLIDNAPEDGVTPHVVAIAPVLKLLAGQLRHSSLYPSKLDLGF